jgi:hypothetical protein
VTDFGPRLIAQDGDQLRHDLLVGVRLIGFAVVQRDDSVVGRSKHVPSAHDANQSPVLDDRQPLNVPLGHQMRDLLDRRARLDCHDRLGHDVLGDQTVRLSVLDG